MRPVSTPALALVLSLAALSGCSKKAEDAAPETTASSAADTEAARLEAGAAMHRAGQASADAVPGFDPSAAPDVAFTYAYAFTLPEAAIGPVQQQHIAACEKLGRARCVITTARYDKSPSGNIDAALELKVTRGLAYAFSSEATRAVQDAQGTLQSSSVSGDQLKDTTTDPTHANQLRGQLAAGEQAVTAARGKERTAQADNQSRLAAKLEAEQARLARGEAIGWTPLRFTYTPEAAVTGHTAMGRATAGSWAAASAATLFLTQLALAIGPWLLLLGAPALIGWRLARRGSRKTAA
ncbi:MAG: hypothetical protein KGN34_16360 [Sphingomonadales bacterium]|nr:hypothetical protein [Sphingomonadales bacterium]